MNINMNKRRIGSQNKRPTKKARNVASIYTCAALHKRLVFDTPMPNNRWVLSRLMRNENPNVAATQKYTNTKTIEDLVVKLLVSDCAIPWNEIQGISAKTKTRALHSGVVTQQRRGRRVFLSMSFEQRIQFLLAVGVKSEIFCQAALSCKTGLYNMLLRRSNDKTGFLDVVEVLLRMKKQQNGARRMLGLLCKDVIPNELVKHIEDFVFVTL